jgi:hypothetical protein
MDRFYNIGESVKDYLVLDIIKVNGKKRYKCQCQKCNRVHIVEKKQIATKKRSGCVDCYEKDRNDIIGKKFGNLTVIGILGHNIQAKNQLYLCRCDCGREYQRQRNYITNNNHLGCINCCFKEATNKRLRDVWNNIKRRCYNEKHISYKNYGAKGIKVCKEWIDEDKGFDNFCSWALGNGYKEEILTNGRNKWTIDRIDVNGNYEPSNCRWVDMATQAINKNTNRKINYNGETHTLVEWARIYNKCAESISYRLAHGYSVEEAFSTEDYSHKPQLSLYGQPISAEQLCNRLGIKYHQFRYRRKKGWSVEKIYEYFS